MITMLSYDYIEESLSNCIIVSIDGFSKTVKLNNKTFVDEIKKIITIHEEI